MYVYIIANNGGRYRHPRPPVLDGVVRDHRFTDVVLQSAETLHMRPLAFGTAIQGLRRVDSRLVLFVRGKSLSTKGVPLPTLDSTDLSMIIHSLETGVAPMQNIPRSQLPQL